jgi:signal transduction histidine kinase
MRIFWLILLLMWSVISLGQSKSIVFELNTQFKENTLLGHLSRFSTGSPNIGINRLIADSTHQFVFIPIETEIWNAGYDPRYHWIKCQLKNTGKKSQALVFGVGFPYLDDIGFYVIDEKNTIRYQQEHLSRKTPFEDRPLVSRYFAFPVQIEPNQTLTLYCRLQRQNSVLIPPFKLFARKVFLANGFTIDFWLTLSLGILLIAFLTSLALFLTTQRRILLYFASFILFFGVFILGLEGIWTQYVDFIPFLDENTHLVMIGFSIFSWLGFTIDFLQIVDYLPKIVVKMAHWVSYSGLLLGFYVLFTPLSYVYFSLMSSFGFVGISIVVGLTLLALKHRRTEAFISLFAFLPVCILLGWLTLNILGKVERSWFFYQMTPFCFTIQIATLGIGLGYKLVKEHAQSILDLAIVQRQQTEAILQTQESERQRIAADLHDDLGGTLATIRRRIADIRQNLNDPNAAKEFELLEPLIQKSGDDLRRISHNLMPPEFAHLGLASALGQFVQAIPHTPTYFEFLISGKEQRLPMDIELNLYRIVSELVQNILKHAQATRAAVQLIYFDDLLTITVEDNGVGSRLINKPSEIPEVSSGIGLKNSKLRAEYIGAKLCMETSAGGTLVILEIPYPPTDNDASPPENTSD